MVKSSIHRPTKATVNLKAIEHNVKWLKSQIDDEQKIYATVKADGYGHGAVAVSRAALQAGANGLAVATVDEAIEIRQAGLIQVPILVLGLTDPHGIADILHYNLTITVGDAEFFRLAYQHLEDNDQLSLLSLYKLDSHLAIDTGMSRIGVTTKDAVVTFAEEIKAFPWVNWTGAFTHFSTAGGGPEDYIEYQWQMWQELNEALPESVSERHFANSAMGMWHNEKSPKSTIIRFGIAMYGIDPKDSVMGDEGLKSVEEASIAALKPALELTTEIIHVKEVPAGTSISYGATYQSSEPEWIATLPIGYADGWQRYYRVVPVLIDGKYAEVAGVINMDQMMIRLPKAYPVGTTVTLIGKNGQLENHPSLIAKRVGTIGYEILTSIGPRVPRVYLS